MQLSGELMIMVALPGGASQHLRLGYKYLDTNVTETDTYLDTRCQENQDIFSVWWNFHPGVPISNDLMQYKFFL